MRNKTILSFIKPEIIKPAIDRSRHINSQLAVSPDSPDQFRSQHTKVDKILFHSVKDPELQKKLEFKRVQSLGKGVNMPEYQIQQRQNLGLIEDFKVNESFQESENKLIRKEKFQIKLYDTITSESRSYNGSGRVIDQKRAFDENYSTYSKNGFKLKSGIFEQYGNFKVGMKSYMNPPKTLLRSKINVRIPRTKRILNSTIDGSSKLEDTSEIFYNNPIQYQNQLQFRITQDLINQKMRQRRTISYN